MGSIPTDSRVRVYIACSLDGFIAGPGDDLSWLPQPDTESKVDSARDSGALEFGSFLDQVGALAMGRRTYDAVTAFDGVWPYGERPVFVATHRALEPTTLNVRGVAGDISEVIAAAREAAGEKDVYLDGGALIRQAVDAGLVDEITVTFVPVLLGQGVSLFAGVTKRHALELVGHSRFGSNLLQLHLRPNR